LRRPGRSKMNAPVGEPGSSQPCSSAARHPLVCSYDPDEVDEVLDDAVATLVGSDPRKRSAVAVRPGTDRT
jgi:hypothetical protein